MTQATSVLTVVLQAMSALVGGYLDSSRSPSAGVWWLVALRFGVGIGVGGQLTSGYSLMVEIVGPAQRALFGGLTWVIWVALLCSNSLIAWVVDSQYQQYHRDHPHDDSTVGSWRATCLATALPLLPPLHAWLPESPRAAPRRGGSTNHAQRSAMAAAGAGAGAGRRRRRRRQRQQRRHALRETNVPQRAQWHG